MEDKIGVALALNRLGVNYFNIGRADKSVEFHLKNLELSDRENCFAAYYNLGIAYRSLKNYEESLKYFQGGFDWAQEFKVRELIIHFLRSFTGLGVRMFVSWPIRNHFNGSW